MSDVLKGLARLKEAREEEVREAQPERRTGTAAAPEALPPVRGEDKTLAGRVPLTLHRRFARLLLDVADELGVNRVYTDEALEAALLLLLEDEEVRSSWQRRLSEVRQDRRGR